MNFSYRPIYRAHEVNHCPGCGRTQWLIGRVTAECAFCATALPLATEAQPRAIFIRRNGGHNAD